MIYVQEKSFKNQLQLMRLVAKKTEFYGVLWAYPEFSDDEFAGLKFQDFQHEELEPVTTYESGEKAKRSERFLCDAQMLELISSLSKDFSKKIDSFCIYKNGESRWVACTIGHEGMGLVQDEGMFNSLIEAGFNASVNPPDWW